MPLFIIMCVAANVWRLVSRGRAVCRWSLLWHCKWGKYISVL